jgi:hypothetical protein
LAAPADRILPSSFFLHTFFALVTTSAPTARFGKSAAANQSSTTLDPHELREGGSTVNLQLSSFSPPLAKAFGVLNSYFLSKDFRSDEVMRSMLLKIKPPSCGEARTVLACFALRRRT